MLFDPEFLRYLREDRGAAADPSIREIDRRTRERAAGSPSRSLSRTIDRLRGAVQVVLWLVELIGSVN
jgi:hypothetical protein